MKYVVFLGDGMADYPLTELGGKTPLEAARHPAMDFIASTGELGLARTIPEGMPTGSDVANLAALGYDPARYYTGRSPFEALNIGVDLAPGDVTYRCNLVTLEGGLGGRMADYSAGEIASHEAKGLIELMNRRFATETVRFYPGVSYRHCLVLKNAADGAKLTPPHDISGRSVADRLPEGEHSKLLREMMEYSIMAFGEHPINLARRAAGKNPASCVWFWGEGRRPELPPFKEKYGVSGGMISAVDLLHGIAACAGLRNIHVDNITGNYHTDFAAKGRAAIAALGSGCDFLYIHVEAPDECGHHGQLREKVWSIEQIDSGIVAPVMEYLNGCGEEFAVMVLPDHPTPISLLTHSADPVPFAICKSWSRGGSARRFTEQHAAATGLAVGEGHALMDRLFARP